jgi:hypothetical protein
MNETYYVLYKENDNYKLTPCDNHLSTVQDANKITTFKQSYGFDTKQKVLDYITTYTNIDADHIVDETEED